MDIWVAISLQNANKLIAVLRAFGFVQPEIVPELFLKDKQIIRMGVAPVKIEVSTGIDGVKFSDCYSRRVMDILDGVPVSLISLNDLKVNKAASGRHKDLNDLENLP